MTNIQISAAFSPGGSYTLEVSGDTTLLVTIADPENGMNMGG